MKEEDKKKLKEKIGHEGGFLLHTQGFSRTLTVKKHSLTLSNASGEAENTYSVDSVEDAVQNLKDIFKSMTEKEIEENLRKENVDETKQLYLIHFPV